MMHSGVIEQALHDITSEENISLTLRDFNHETCRTTMTRQFSDHLQIALKWTGRERESLLSVRVRE